MTARTDWPRAEIAALFDLPFTELVFRAAEVHRAHHAAGSGHPAKLNLGDCFAYALATERGEPLLYKGDDFAPAGVARAA